MFTMCCLLFVFFINDLPECVTYNSELYLYADDTKIFRELKDEEDCKKLQHDINDVYLWSKKMAPEFSPRQM